MVHLADLPCETHLQALKFLSYKQLCDIQPAAVLFNKLIGRFKHELALQKFHDVKIKSERQIAAPVCSRNKKTLTFDIVKHFESYSNNYRKNRFDWLISNEEMYGIGRLEPEQEKEWENALMERIPLFNGPVGYVVIVISISPFSLENRQLFARIPTLPTSIDDLFFARFWIDQLARCYFRSSFAIYDCAIFNPKMLKLLFVSDKSLKTVGGCIRFHSANTSFESGNITNKQGSSSLPELALQFFGDHLFTGCLDMNLSLFDANRLLEFLTKAGVRIAKVKFADDQLSTELPNALIQHAECCSISNSLMNIVPEISFTYYYKLDSESVGDFLSSLDLRTAQKMMEMSTNDQYTERDEHVSKYRLENMHSKDQQHFLITINREHVYRYVFEKFNIERVNNSDTNK